MRKLKLQVQMSIDGFIAGPKGEMDWLTWDFDPEIMQFISDLNRDVDTILLGRNLAEGFIPHWAAEATDPAKKRDFVEKMSGPYDFAMKMHETPKVVFSKKLEVSPWENAALAGQNFVKEVKSLKKSKGGDLIAYGGGTFVSSLIQAGLVDEFFLFVNPVAIGKGMPIFRKLAKKQALKLVKSVGFPCGIAVLQYARQLKK